MRWPAMTELALVAVVGGCGGKTSHDDATAAPPAGGAFAGATSGEGASSQAGSGAVTGEAGGAPATEGGGDAGGNPSAAGTSATGGSAVGGTGATSTGSGGCSGVLTDVEPYIGGGDDYVAEAPGCPLDPSLPECASADEGAVVARTGACFDASLAAHDCVPWAYPADSMLVLLPSDHCVGPTELASVKRWVPCDGPAEVRIEYVQREWCEPCDSATPSWGVLWLPSDPARVIAERLLAGAAPCVER